MLVAQTLGTSLHAVDIGIPDPLLNRSILGTSYSVVPGV